MTGSGPPGLPGQVDPRHEALYHDLLVIHGMLRSGLAAVAELAARAEGGADPAALGDDVATLARDSALWRLRSNCLYQCQFVHHHHGLEDAAVFPAVRRADPSIAAEVDRLEADHRVVAAHLVDVEDAARALVDGGADARSELVAALHRLETDLLDHLDREERLLRPVLARMGSWFG